MDHLKILFCSAFLTIDSLKSFILDDNSNYVHTCT